MRFLSSSFRTHILGWLGACLLIWLGGWFLATGLSDRLPERSPSSSLPVEIASGWEYRWGDLPVNAAGIPADLNGWQPLSVPGKLAKPPREKIVWLRVKLPAVKIADPSIDLGGITYLEVYLHDRLLDRYGEANHIGQISRSDRYWPIVKLNPDFAGKTLFLKVAAGRSSGTLPIFSNRTATLGSQVSILQKIIRENISQFVLGCFFVFAGIFPLLISLIQPEKKAYFSFGLLAICTGAFTVTKNNISLLFFENSPIYFYVSLAALYFMPAAVCALFEDVFNAGYKLIIRRLRWINISYAIAAIALDAAIAIDALDSSYWETAANLFSILFIITILTIFAHSVAIAFKGNNQARLFTAGFTIFGLLGLHDVLTIINIIPGNREFYYWGLLAFIVTIGLMGEQKLAEASRNLRNYAQELEIKNAALQQMDKLKDEFLASTSHELRTPLNGIIGITESLIDGAAGKLTPPQIANLSLVVASGMRLANLVNDILDFAKLKYKNLQLQISPVDMRSLADVVLSLCQPLIGNRPVKLINRIAADVPAVDADENRVQQILYNLVGNAIKFTDAGKVEIYAQATGKYLEITVTDDGIGIAPDKLEKIFGSFEQAEDDTARHYGGTGLGLAVTKKLVELHGGKIWVESAEGEGAKFIFTLLLSAQTNRLLPAETASSLPAAKLPDGEPDANTNNGSSSLSLSLARTGEFKVLIVDDEPVNLQVLVNHLSLYNYAIAQANSGADALAILASGFKPDLVLLDVMMPRMTGYETCRKIREKYPANELPVVFLTANDQVVDLAEWVSAGANDYLTKPVSKNELIARVKTHLHLAKLNLAYSRFVPREFLRFLGKESIVDVRLGDQVQKEMTILFSDIRSFTTLSESMSPKENFDFLNSYLKRVGPVIRQHNGFIDKYIGDAIMALFPDSPEDALKAAINMQKQVTIYNSHRKNSGYPAIAIGIGVHTGTLMLGTIGEEQRMESTVISDAVNLASRMEGLTKLYGSGIVISEQTLCRLEEPQNYSFRFLDKVKVKGKKAAVAVFEVYDGESEKSIKLKRQINTDFEQAVYLYHQNKLDAAKQIFERLLQINEHDPAIKLYLRRCDRQAAEDIVTSGWAAAADALEEKL